MNNAINSDIAPADLKTLEAKSAATVEAIRRVFDENTTLTKENVDLSAVNDELRDDVNALRAQLAAGQKGPHISRADQAEMDALRDQVSSLTRRVADLSQEVDRSEAAFEVKIKAAIESAKDTVRTVRLETKREVQKSQAALMASQGMLVRDQQKLAEITNERDRLQLLLHAMTQSVEDLHPSVSMSDESMGVIEGAAKVSLHRADKVAVVAH
jgi:DNA repair exonuclease SbcCD ATPase subunit